MRAQGQWLQKLDGLLCSHYVQRQGDGSEGFVFLLFYEVLAVGFYLETSNKTVCSVWCPGSGFHWDEENTDLLEEDVRIVPFLTKKKKKKGAKNRILIKAVKQSWFDFIFSHFFILFSLIYLHVMQFYLFLRPGNATKKVLL